MDTVLQEKHGEGSEYNPNQRWESKENDLYLSSYAKKIYDKSKHYTYGMPESLLRSSIGAQYLLYVGTVTQR